MSNENKKMERSWLSSTAMKLALLSASAASLVSCEGLVDRTDVYGAGGVYMGGTRTTSQTNLAKIGLAAAGLVANTYVALDNNDTAVKIAQVFNNHIPHGGGVSNPIVNRPPVQNGGPTLIHRPIPVPPCPPAKPVPVHECVYGRN